jgi:hypothetical protein
MALSPPYALTDAIDRESAANIAKLMAGQFLTRDNVRHGGIRNYRVGGFVSKHPRGRCDSDSKGQK